MFLVLSSIPNTGLGLWGVEGGMWHEYKDAHDSSDCVNLFCDCVFTQKVNFFFWKKLKCHSQIVSFNSYHCFWEPGVSPGHSGRSRPGQMDQPTHCLAAQPSSHRESFTSSEATGSSKQAPRLSQKEACSMWPLQSAPARRTAWSSQLLLPVFFSLHI